MVCRPIVFFDMPRLPQLVRQRFLGVSAAVWTLRGNVPNHTGRHSDVFAIRPVTVALCLSSAGVVLGAMEPVAPIDKATVSFDEQIRPILQAKCIRCHGEKQRKGELDLRGRESMLT